MKDARKKKKKGAEINIDATSISFILLGIILGIFVYSSGSNGIIGNLVKSILLGCIGNIMYAVPIILMFLGVYVIFRDFSRFKLKSFLVLIMVFLSAAIMSTFKAPIAHLDALKEAGETEYWLELLYKSDYINRNQFENYYNANEEIIRIITTILKTAKKNL